jgi:hypothetical protein
MSDDYLLATDEPGNIGLEMEPLGIGPRMRKVGVHKSKPEWMLRLS